ncbi:PAQR family membrane homeostasis protein TrhA [Acidimangrovimonas pyrenivorans]|uniref:PAQR family membrane homeostasis protein TrhA n=1 Tax=Acidimangrovimonas pyrenivorans TaxID=2030798 RepID=UPI0036732D45
MPVRTEYSRAELISDAVVHVSGLAAVLIAVPVLIAVALWRGSAGEALFAVALYGATLIAMILFSALYNIVGRHRWHGVLRRLDHSAIYAKIAGTYTPFTLIPGGHGGYLLAGLWGAALAGMGLKLISPARLRWLALALYLGMGWAGAVAGGSFFATLSGPVIVLIAVGGGLYTVGVVFYLFERLPFHYTLWHVFVLVASMVFYAAVTVHLVQGTA